MGYIDRGRDDDAAASFSEHFEWTGTRWLYYRNGWKAPVPLSDEEYVRAIKIKENATLAAVALGIGLLAVAMIFFPSVSLKPFEETLWFAFGPPLIGITSFFAAMFAIERWATRPFGSRRPVALPRDRKAKRNEQLSQTSWIAIAFALLALPMLVWWEASSGDWVNAAIHGAMTLFAFYHALRKWRLTRSTFRKRI